MSWHFARTPKWIVRHVLVAALVVTMVLLGFWQLRRLDEKRAFNTLLEARQEQPADEVSDVVPLEGGVGDAALDAVIYRRVRATGTYAADDTVVVPNRTFNSASGGWVLTPLRLPDGRAVLVNRGFVGFDEGGAIVAPAPPPGRVTVEGLVFPSQERGRFGGAGPDEDLDEMARVDLAQFQERVDYDVLPAYVQVVTSDPPEAAPADGSPELVPLGPPDTDEGPHLGYAAQWFIFATIAGGGYVLLLRKVATDGAADDELAPSTSV